MIDLLKNRMGTRLTSHQYGEILSYISAFTRNTSATVSRALIWWELEYSLTEEILNALVEIGTLQKYHAVRCPECSLLLEKVEYTPDYEDESYCYGCDSDITIDASDIDVIYSLADATDKEALK